MLFGYYQAQTNVYSQWASDNIKKTPPLGIP